MFVGTASLLYSSSTNALGSFHREPAHSLTHDRLRYFGLMEIQNAKNARSAQIKKGQFLSTFFIHSSKKMGGLSNTRDHARRMTTWSHEVVRNGPVRIRKPLFYPL